MVCHFLLQTVGNLLAEETKDIEHEIELVDFGTNHAPLQYSCLENPMDEEEPGRLQSMGSLRVGHD